MSTALIFLAVYAIINLIAMAMFVSDKRKAQKGEWRTRESTLLAWSAIGPFGAVAGMELSRHKTRKAKFKLVYVFLFLHVMALAYIYTKWGFDFSF